MTNNSAGPIVRIAPGLLITSSPEVWTHVNKQPSYKRSDWYYHACRVEYRRDNVFTQTDNEKHDMRRKQMAPGVRSLPLLYNPLDSPSVVADLATPEVLWQGES